MILLTRESLQELDSVSRREWLVTNGIGGFACGTIGGLNTRRYHGLLIATLQPPVQRALLLAKLDATVTYRGQQYSLATNEFGDGTIAPRGFVHLDSFALDGQLPVWTWLIGDALLEQRLWMAQGRNTTYVSFRLIRGEQPLRLDLTPLCTHRDFHSHHRGYRDTLVTPLANGVQVDVYYGARSRRKIHGRSARARRHLSPGDRLELAARPLCLRSLPSPSRLGACAHIPRRRSLASARRVHRPDQRNFRRRRPIHARRLLRAGVGCRRDSESLGRIA